MTKKLKYCPPPILRTVGSGNFRCSSGSSAPGTVGGICEPMGMGYCYEWLPGWYTK